MNEVGRPAKTSNGILRRLMLVLVAAALGAYALWHLTHDAMAFDRERWLARPDGSQDLLRHRMADALVASGGLVGKAKREAEAMLGPSNGHGYFNDECLVYPLGPERGAFSIDTEWLVLSCDASGVVVRAMVRSD